jgi:hypothetical protein
MQRYALPGVKCESDVMLVIFNAFVTITTLLLMMVILLMMLM